MAFKCSHQNIILGADYGTVRVRYLQNSIDSGTVRYVYFYLQLPADPRLTSQAMVVGRNSHLAPVWHRCPYHTSDRPSSTHIPLFFLFYIEFILYVDHCATWSP